MKPIPTSTFAEQETAKRVEHLAQSIKAALDSPEAEAIHEVRIACRRLEPVLELLRPCFDKQKVKKIRHAMRAILSAAGAARDCDVALKWFAKLRNPEDTDLRAKLHIARAHAVDRLTLALKAHTVEIATHWTENLAVAHPQRKFCLRPIEETAHRKLAESAQEFFDAGLSAAASGSARQLHGMRIAAKRFRYALELFQAPYGIQSRLWIAQVRNVQSLLGNINNLRTVRKIVARLGSDPEFETHLRKQQHKKMRRFAKLWESEFPPAVVRQWMSALG